jgi:hypothetical protein
MSGTPDEEVDYGSFESNANPSTGSVKKIQENWLLLT